MRTRSSLVLTALLLSALGAGMLAVPSASKEGSNFYEEGLKLYKAERYSEASEAFEKAVKLKQNKKDSEKYIERIRKELEARKTARPPQPA